MNLRHELEIPPDDPFKFDKLKREEEAKTLTNLVKNYSDGFVLALNNEWGAGKTTFVKMWQAYLKKERVESLYFNAWENDYQQDVLVALLSELDELKDDQKAKFKDVVKKAVPFAGNVALGALKGLVANYGLDKVLTGAIDGTIKGSESLLKSEIDAYSKRKDGLKDFQKSLEAYAKAVSGEHPLVFIIDELDRCRPNYAVEVLEQIKHIFSVPGIVFVLAIDKVQLGHAVKGVYGSPGMDDIEYLRRFIDVEFSLPKPSTEDYVRYLYEYFGIRTLVETKFDRESADIYVRDFCKFIGTLATVFDFTLRQIAHVMSLFKITLTAYLAIYALNPSTIILLAMLKMKKNDLYIRIRDLKIGEQELIDELLTLLPPEIADDDGWTIAIISYAYNKELKRTHREPGELVQTNANGNKSMRLNYGKFNPKNKYPDYFESISNTRSERNYRTGLIISRLELSEKHFKTH